jgi:hypothetical protein
VAWVGDASTSYGIGIIIGVKWSRFRLRRGWDAVEADGSRRDIAWAETVALRLGLIMLCMLKEVQGKEFLVLTDNVVTEGAVRNGKSKNRWVNQEWIKIQDETLRLNCRLKQMRVKSADNAADLLSTQPPATSHWQARDYHGFNKISTGFQNGFKMIST